MIYVIAAAVFVVIVATGWLVYEVLTAPELCGDCGRPLHGGLCPDCQADVIVWLEEQNKEEDDGNEN